MPLAGEQRRPRCRRSPPRSAEAAGLRLGGLMAVAPLGADPAQAFDRLRGISTRLRADQPVRHHDFGGMSGDAAEAIAAGATHVRIGGAILVSERDSGNVALAFLPPTARTSPVAAGPRAPARASARRPAPSTSTSTSSTRTEAH